MVLYALGQRKHILDGQAKNCIEINGALRRCEKFAFNYIHGYDVISAPNFKLGSSLMVYVSLPASTALLDYKARRISNI